MPRSFDVLAESAASVERIHAAFGLESYWLARLDGDSTATLDSLLVATDGTVTVNVTQHLVRGLLPGPIARVVPGGGVKLLYRETWRPVGDGRVRGDVDVTASGGMGSTRARNWLTPAGTVSELRSAVRVEVRIPLVGGQLEKTIGASLAESIPATLRFTTTWIADHQ